MLWSAGTYSRGNLASTWRRPEPEGTVLYRVLEEHLDTFLARIADDDKILVRAVSSFCGRNARKRGFALRVRAPGWLREPPRVTVNGTTAKAAADAP